MAFGGIGEGDASRPLAEINMIPLIDVMLVLLIIFIVTAPLLTHSIKINLPQASAQVNVEKPETVTLTIDAGGALYWNDEPVERPALTMKLQEAARRDPQPALHLRAEKLTPYQRLAEVMAAAQKAGMQKVGFITEPERGAEGRAARP